METTRSCIKCLRSTCEIVSYLYLVAVILQLLHEISSFPEVLYKRDILKNFSKFTEKHKKQPSGGVLSKDVFKNFAKFTEKHLCRSLLFNKVSGWKPETVRSSHCRCQLFKNTYLVEDLRTAGSETKVRGSFFNKVASMTI